MLDVMLKMLIDKIKIEQNDQLNSEEIFENEPDFVPITEKDQIIIEAMKQIINKNNIKEENEHGGIRKSSTHRRKNIADMQRLFQNLSGQRSRNAAVPTFGNFFTCP